MPTTPSPPPRKKLIEVALPLEAINRESAREKSIRHGHPSTLHLWWARRPLAACRAVLFSSLVDDPSSDPRYRRADGTVDEERAGAKRAELFNLITDLVKWENSNNPDVITKARAEIARCVASRKLELGELDKAMVIHGPGKGKLHPDGPLPPITTREKVGTTTWQVSITQAKPDAVNAFLAEHAPPVLDPFCGGGSIPLEAQRLGLRAYASDLNPVPVLITKALIEIPPKFAGMPPVNPESRGLAAPTGPDSAGGKGKKKTGKHTQGRLGDGGFGGWKGASGLAEDVRYYGRWMRDEAQKGIGHLYPKIKVTEAMARDRKDLKEYIGQELTVIAWLWARTVPSPNPAAGGAHVPLVRSFWLSTKEGKKAWVEPVITPDGKSYKFEVRIGAPGKDFDPKKGTVVRTGATCLLTNQPMPFEHVRAEAKAGRMAARLMAIVAEGARGRVYLSPTPEHEKAAEVALPRNIPDTPIPEQALGFRVQLYGMDKHYKLFTNRQLTALMTFTDLVMEARAKVLFDARAVWMAGGGAADSVLSPAAGSPRVPSNGANKGSRTPYEGTYGASAASSAAEDGDSETADGAESYADAVATYLAFAVSKLSDNASALCSWHCGAEHQKIRGTFGRQTLSMTWDYAEGNMFSDSTGNFFRQIELVEECVQRVPANGSGEVVQRDAAASIRDLAPITVSTDPPYYDNIGYADLSDYFYTWLRKSLTSIYPSLFRTLLTPKAEELIAAPYRHEGSRERAMAFFETGLGRVFERMREAEHADYPLTVFYAFKQAENDEADADDEREGETTTASTGWETLLEGMIGAGLSITGTWPSRSELSNRMRGLGSNALASSIVLVCHPRPDSAPMASRREFVAALKRELPTALRDLRSGNIAPVDLAQAAIGPGMAVYSRYSRVLETDGSRMGVRTALTLINQVLDEVLTEQEGEYDADTRWCIKWFEQYAHSDGPYGDANTLANAMAVGVDGLKETGVLIAKGGKVRLFKRTELMGGEPATWDPATDSDILHWEVCQYLIWALEAGGEQAAADLLRRINAVYAGATEVARDLAYRLYTVCERKKWAQEALSYNALIVAWPEIQKLASKAGVAVSSGPEGLFSVGS